MTRIVCVIQTLGSGGAEKQLLSIAERLRRRGFRVDLLPIAAGDTNAWESELSKSFGDNIRVLAPLSLSAEGWAALGSLGAGDVLWSWGNRADLICWAVRLARRCRWVASLRSSSRGRFERTRGLHRAMTRFVDLYVSNTSVALEILEELVPRIRGRGVVLPNLAPSLRREPRAFEPGHPLVVGMLGNLRVATKGYDVLCDVARASEESRLPFVFKVAGRPDELSEFREHLKRTGAKNVEYVGSTSVPFEFLAGCDAFLLLSRFEGVPNALLEAMAAGLPVVSTPVGDLPNLFRDGDELLFVDLKNVRGIVEALERCLSDSEAARRRAIAAQLVLDERLSSRAVESALAVILSRLELTSSI